MTCLPIIATRIRGGGSCAFNCHRLLTKCSSKMSAFPLLALPTDVIGLVGDCLSSDDRKALSFVNRACYKAICRHGLPIVFLASLDGTLTRNGIVTHVDSLDTANVSGQARLRRQLMALQDANYIFEVADDSPGNCIVAYDIFPRWFDQLPGLRG